MLRLTIQEDWVSVFARAKHGHTLWDGNAANPHDASLAVTTAEHFVSHAQSFGMFGTGHRILDLGCGNGRFGIVFSRMNVEYEGIDPMQECIEFAQEAFKRHPHLKFHWTPVHHPAYGLSGPVDMEHFRLDFPDSHFDDVIVYSVFTHLQTLPIAWNYMNEVKRVLKSGGRLFVTWYRSPPNPATTEVGRTTYPEWEVMNLMAGFRLLFTYGGHSAKFYDQWGMFAQKY